jgi:endo-1,4-beta-xylanase
MLTRRDFLAAGTAACLTPTASAQTRDVPALRDLGAAVGIEVGSAFSLDKDPKYRALVAKHCAVITPEWQMKPPRIKPDAESDYDFSVVDQFVRFTEEHGQKLHGHTLYWSYEPIEWAIGADFEETKEFYGLYIANVMERYPQVETWDVANELIDDETFRLRPDYLVGRYGVDFIDFCFHTAHQMSPTAKLAINDYWIECAAEVCGNKRKGVLDLLTQLRERGTPIHALGIQSHLYSKMPIAPEETLELVEAAAGLGLEVWISELDVNDTQFPEDTEERDALVADVYARYLNALLPHPAVKRLAFWGISDYDHWIARGEPKWERRPAWAGAARPALFDANNEPKPAFDAAVRALRAAPPR